MTGQDYVEVQGLTVDFDGFKANEDVDVTFLQGRINFLIGPNGAGKTTLVDALTGLVKGTGYARYGNKDLLSLKSHQISRAGVGRTFQTATVSQLWRLSQGGQRELGTTRIATHCFAEALGDDRLVCSAFDGTRTRILVLDPTSGAISALGTVDGMFASYERAPTGWLTGWCNSTPVALRLGTREVVAASGREPGFIGFATGERSVGTITSTGTGSTIRVFPL